LIKKHSKLHKDGCPHLDLGGLSTGTHFDGPEWTGNGRNKGKIQNGVLIFSLKSIW